MHSPHWRLKRDGAILLHVNSFLHGLSAFCFYVLGLSFLACAVLLRNGIGGTWPSYWMQVADLPLALSATLFAGMSLARSVRSVDRPSLVVPAIIAVVLSVFFLALVTLNFWPLIGPAVGFEG